MQSGPSQLYFHFTQLPLTEKPVYTSPEPTNTGRETLQHMAPFSPFDHRDCHRPMEATLQVSNV